MPEFRSALKDDKDVEIVSQQDVVSELFYPDFLYKLIGKIAKHQLWRFEKHAGRPGWIIQQIVKLACNHWVDEGAVVFIDSDLIFIRPFDLMDLGLTDTTRTLVRITPKDESSKHRSHVDQSRRILSLPPGSSEHHYMAYPTIWYVDWLKELHNYIQNTANSDWQKAMYTAKHISEYTIYGVFVEEVLKPANLSIRARPFNIIAWDLASFESTKTRMLNAEDSEDDRISLVIQSNLKIPTSAYEDLLRHIICQ